MLSGAEENWRDIDDNLVAASLEGSSREEIGAKED
jgi:hypothetical protein